MIKIERIYEDPRGSKGFRILVDRLWPRGLSKDMVRCCSKLFVKEMVWPRRKEMGSIQTPGSTKSYVIVSYILDN